MDYKNRMILFFILIAIIPIAALSVVFTTTVIKFKDEMSTVYDGFVSNLSIISKNKSDIAGIKADLVQFSSTTNESQRDLRISHILELKAGIDGSMDSYKRVEDLPNAFNEPFGPALPVDRFNISKIVSDEALLINAIDQQWSVFSSRVDDLSILASDPSFSLQANAEANQMAALADTLVFSYDSLEGVNAQIGAASRERSLQTMQLAFIYGGLASAISAASATAAAILVSKRVVLGDIVRMTKLDLVETTLRDLIGGGADALLATVKNQMEDDKAGTQIATAPRADVETALVPSQEDIVIGRSRVTPSQPAGKKAFVEDYEPLAPAGQELKGKLVMVNYGDNSKASSQAAWILEQLFETSDLILLTRKGSNFYRQAQGKYVMYILGDGNLKGRKAENVISAVDETKLAHAVEELVRENPTCTLLVDNATELIYTLGFEQVFSFLRKISEVVSTFEDSSIVVIINKKAHEPRIIEAIGNISNVFVD